MALQYAYTFDDIALVPQYNNIKSRTIPTLQTWLTTKTQVNCPLIPANMDSVISDDLADVLINYGGIPIFHRFTDKDIQLTWAHKYGNKCFMSCGLNDMDFTLKLLQTDIRGVCVDIAHGHSETMKNFIFDLRKHVGNTKEIIAGNICSVQAYQDLVNWGVDAVKVGIGPGCFTGDTKILMANSTYKNIIDIEPGDRVINMNGKPVTVLDKMYMGKKEIISIKTALHESFVHVTPDHNFYIYDPKTNTYRWEEIDKCYTDNLAILCPRNIEWELPNNIKIDSNVIQPSYELGYIIGAFLTNNIMITEQKIIWYAQTHTDDSHKTLRECINKLYHIHPEIKEGKTVYGRLYYYEFYSEDLYCMLVHNFGIGVPKHFNDKFYCKNIQYIRGLYDGLISNSMNYGLEPNDHYKLFNWCYLSLGIPFTYNNSKYAKALNDHLYADIRKKHTIKYKKNVWDIEVDCPTHSFIANNMIVHNSCCKTRTVTGFGIPQWSAIYECAQVAQKLRVPIIADGGIRDSRDVALALAAGASTVMIGGLFSNTYESAAEKVTKDNIIYSKYRGQASEDFQFDFYGEMKGGTVAEGISFEKVCDKSAKDVIETIYGGLRSALTYGGSRNIKELQRKAEFRLVTPSYLQESRPRPYTK